MKKKSFRSIAPDFVLELISPSDRLSETQEKMQEYLKQGVKLGWLIERKNRQVEIYRLGRDVQVLDFPITLSGEEVLPGFVLDLRIVWD